jgi:predicted secreted protein
MNSARLQELTCSGLIHSKPITNFSYDAATDRLSYQSDKLAYGGHKVKVKATDADGLEGKKTWRFKVVKR